MSQHFPKTELLYFGQGHSSSNIAMHAHPYYQLEYCCSGKLSACNNDQKIILKAGDFWLISPGQQHSFSATHNQLEFISIKFNTLLPINSLISNAATGQFYLDEIRKIIDGDKITAYSAEGKNIIEHLLSGILVSLEKNDVSKQTSEFEMRLRQMICKAGASLNIHELAEIFHISRAEFKYLFQKEIGHGQIKKYINETLLSVAEQHLKYSDMTISRIAEELCFSSIYAFSRFYKHYRKISPVIFRKSCRKHE